MSHESFCEACKSRYCVAGVETGDLLGEACMEMGADPNSATVVDVLNGLIMVSRNGSEYGPVMRNAWKRLAGRNDVEEVGLRQVAGRLEIIGKTSDSRGVTLGILAEEECGSRMLWPKGGGVVASAVFPGGAQPEDVVCFFIQAARGIRYGTEGDHVNPGDPVRKTYAGLFVGNDGTGWTSEMVVPEVSERLVARNGERVKGDDDGKRKRKKKN